jgi:GNAT superfamily N-acetyltransferase
MITLRTATQDDEKFALKIHHNAFKELVENQYGYWNDTDQDKYFKDSWNYKKTNIIQKDMVDCGYVKIIDNEEEIIIDDIAIDPSFHNMGIGTKIIEDILKKAINKNCPVKLIVSLKNNAFNLYNVPRQPLIPPLACK